MIEAVVAWSGGQPLSLRVIDGNDAAISAYEKQGFAMLGGNADDEGCRIMVWDLKRGEAHT